MKTAIRSLVLLSALLSSGAAIGQQPQQPWWDVALAGTRQLLSEKRFADARVEADRVIQLLLQDDRIDPDDERAALVQAVVFRAIAESRTMRNDLAQWDWYIAANLSPSYTAELQTRVEGAGSFPKMEGLWDPPADLRRVGPADPLVQAPKIVARPEPVYPMRARRLHLEARVVIASFIDAKGQISKPRVLTPDLDPSLIFASLDALSKWGFEPARLGSGASVTVMYNLTINFKLDPQS